MTESRLCQMPNEVLLRVMLSLTRKSLRALRKTSPKFLHLFAADDFKEHHQNPARVGYCHEMWPTIKRPLGRARSPTATKFNIKEARAGYCDACFEWLKDRATRDRAPELEYYHCSGCKSDHHARLFSAAELIKTPHGRICLGRQGYISLCDHRNISYADVLRAQLGDSGHRQVFECRHPSHDFAPDHTYGGELVDAYLAGDSSSETDPAHPLGHRRKRLSLAKGSHATFPVEQGARPTAQQFRDFLFRLQRTSPTPWFPLENPSLTPLRKMDPNKCLCFDYQGSDLFDYPVRPNPPEEATCVSLWSGQAGYKDEPRCNDRAHEESERFDHFNTGFSIGLRPCTWSLGHPCMTLIYWRNLSFYQPWESQWIYALNPQSYGRLEFALQSPCTTKTCRNYMKYETYGPLFGGLGEDNKREKLANRLCGRGFSAR